MSGVSCLYRRSSGIYAVRLAVPARLRPSLGRGEIHVSTGLRDGSAAKIAALKIQTHWREKFMTLDLEKLTAANPLLQGDDQISICDAAKAIGLSDNSLLNELLNERASVFTYAQDWPGWHVEDLDLIDKHPEDGFNLNSVEMHGSRFKHSGIVRSYGTNRALAALQAEGKATVSVFYLTGNAAFFTDDEVTVPLTAWLVRKSSVERVRVRLARSAPTETRKPATAPIKPAGDHTTASHTPDPKQEGKRFSDLFALYSAHQKWTPAHQRRMAAEAGMFSELMNDPPLTDIGVEMIHNYAALLAQLPTDVYQAKRKHPKAALRDLIGIAQRDSLPLKNSKTVSDHVARLGQVFAYGVSPAGMMHVNSADKFKRGWGGGRKTNARHDRDEFTPEQLALIFSQDWFSSGTGKINEKGRTHWRPHHFWLPVLALTTGGRLNELAQLYLDDVQQSDKDSAVWYLDFNLAQPDKVDSIQGEVTSDKSLKTINSQRVIPLHELVIRAGLPEYVATLRKAGEVRLFPELKRDANKGYGKPAGSWFNERFLGRQLGIARDGKKTFHSFRHTFATAAERLEIPEPVLAQLLGHKRGKTQAMMRYVKDRDAATLKPIVDRLKFPELDGLGRFDPDAALQAIKRAKRLKQAIARSKT